MCSQQQNKLFQSVPFLPKEGNQVGKPQGFPLWIFFIFLLKTLSSKLICFLRGGLEGDV